MDDLFLRVGGQRFYGWKSFSVTRTMESIVNRFDVRAADIEADRRMLAITDGDPVELFLDDDLLLTGYLQDILPDYDDKKHERLFLGDSRTVDLVDSTTAGQQFRDQDLLQVATALAKPYGIAVSATVPVGEKFSYLNIDTGQNVWEFLEYAGRMRGLRFIATDTGDMVIDEVGSTVSATTLLLGGNVLRAKPRFSHRDRHSDYTVVSDQPQTESLMGTDSAFVKGSARDPRVRRYRPVHILSEFAGDIAQCNAQALWQSKLAYARSQSVVYTVKGWRDDSGNVWTPNTLVPVRDKYAPLNERMLIVEVTTSLSAAGRLTELLLMKPDALKQTAIPEPEEESTGF